jgi:O-succinylbenzoic acid--CoA ligase
MLTLKNLYYSALGTNEFYGINESDSWPLSIPLNHIGGIMIIIRSIIVSSKVIDLESIRSLPNVISDLGPTTLSVVPTQLKVLLEIPEVITSLKKMKRIIVGGAKTPKWMIKKCQEAEIPISISYGSSEMAAQISATTPGQKDIKPFLTGEILPYRKVTINSDKRITVSGNSLFIGYIENGELIKTGNHFVTNDLGFIDKNELYISGRRDKLLICGGENISPTEIENELEKIDGIAKASIISIPDDNFGEIPFCFIDSDLPFSVIQHQLSKTVPHYKLPHFYNRFPKSNSLKITKQLLVKHLNGQFQLGMPYVKSFGDPSKETLILIHGFMGDMREWDNLADKLDNQFHLLMIDLLGHGRSYRAAPLCRSFNQFVTTLQNCIKNWCGEDKKPTLLGYSMGGRIALGLSCSNPAYYKKVIIESANPGIKDQKLKEERVISDSNLFKNIENQDEFKVFLNKWYKMLLFGKLTDNQRSALVNDKLSFNFSNWKYFSNILSVGNQPDLSIKLTKIKCKTIFISGEQDKKYCSVGKSLPVNFKHIVVKDVGHNTHATNLEIIYSAITN